jgi:uncharacterized protein YqgC (DUF456 family)
MPLDPGGQGFLQAVVLAVMIFGLFSLLLPIMPGLAIIWVAALVYGIATGFSLWSGVIFAVMTVLMLGGNLVDNVMMGAKARQQGASWVAIGVALVAGLAGSLIFPPFGGLIAALIGLFAVEMVRLQDWRKALDSTKSMAIGCGWAAIIRFGVGVVMIVLWVVWSFLL